MTQTIVITGATSGIGQCAAIALARQGAHLILTARSPARAEATLKLIDAAAPRTLVHVYYCDFTSLASVAALGHEIVANHPHIDVLINNAGLHAFSPRITADGCSEMVAVNYLAPWLLTNILRETLVRSAPSRIVTVASQASKEAAGFDPVVALTSTDPKTAATYGQTKMLDIMFSQELARQLEGTGVAVNCLCPGFNVTGLGRELWFAAPLERVLKWLKIGDPERGASIIVRLASDPAFARVTGGFYSREGKALTPAMPGADPQAQHALWLATAERGRWVQAALAPPPRL